MSFYRINAIISTLNGVFIIIK